MLHVVFLISSESSWWVPLHRLGLRLFGATMWKLLIIEPFFQWEQNKIETENFIRIWGTFFVLLESPQRVRFNKVYFTIFRAKVWKILILSGFCCWKFKQITKIGFGRKNHLSSQHVHTWADSIGYTSLSMKQGNLFCFVCHADISQIMALHFAILVFLECSQWVGVQWVGFIMFQSTVEKLMNIEKKCIENSFKSKQKFIREFGHSWYFWKALDE